MARRITALVLLIGLPLMRSAAQITDTIPELATLAATDFQRFGAARVLILDTLIHRVVGDQLMPDRDPVFAVLSPAQLPQHLSGLDVVPGAWAKNYPGPDSLRVSVYRYAPRQGSATSRTAVLLIVQHAAAPNSSSGLVVATLERRGTRWRVVDLQMPTR